METHTCTDTLTFLYRGKKMETAAVERWEKESVIKVKWRGKLEGVLIAFESIKERRDRKRESRKRKRSRGERKGGKSEGKKVRESISWSPPLLPWWNVNQRKEVSPFGVSQAVCVCACEPASVCVCVRAEVKRSDMVFWPFGALSEVLQLNNCTQGSITMPFTTFFTRRSQPHREIQINTALIHAFRRHYHDKEKRRMETFIPAH